MIDAFPRLIHMLTQLLSFATIGLKSEPITVEVGATPGDGDMSIVGLGDTAVQESKQRVRLALRSSGFRLSTGKHITVNLAPADIKKIGPRYDLAIALGILCVHHVVTLEPDALRSIAFLGELALDGSIRHVSGVLSAAIACRQLGIRTLVVPGIDGPEAALVPGIEVIGSSDIRELVDILLGNQASPLISPISFASQIPLALDMADIRGQQQAKRALEIAAAGGHNILFSGAPGSGKTLLAKALRGILPPLTREEALEVTQIYSIANLLPRGAALVRDRPFRSVHHTASGVSIVGGGQIPGPGEISLAHKGVLFLDELAEFPPAVLEVLRQPLEERSITVTRAQGSVTFPADVLLVAAMNPPQCGGASMQRMQKRISAPFLDRIDLTINVQAVPVEELQQKQKSGGEVSAAVAARVAAARERQQARFASCTITTNKEMGIKDVRAHCALDQPSEQLLAQAAERMQLSARSYYRTLKVARTIADLAGEGNILTAHVAEALQYRQPVGCET